MQTQRRMAGVYVRCPFGPVECLPDLPASVRWFRWDRYPKAKPRLKRAVVLLATLSRAQDEHMKGSVGRLVALEGPRYRWKRNM